jgi:hypothetical protein
MALLMDRVLKKEYLYGNIPSRTTHFTPYTDVSIHDPELDQALIKLQKYGIMKGHKNKFYPHKHLK